MLGHSSRAITSDTHTSVLPEVARAAVALIDFDADVPFYSRLFGAAPAKLRSCHANFAIDDRPLKLVRWWPAPCPGTSTKALHRLAVKQSTVCT